MRRASVGLIAVALVAPPPALASGIPSRPDLTVGYVSKPPKRAVPGDRFTADDKTVNRGRGRAASSVTQYSLGSWKLASRPVPALHKGDDSWGHVTVTIPRSIPDGMYRLTACADAQRRVKELSESNNCRSASRRLLIDMTAPKPPRIDGHPDKATRQTSARFAFSSKEPGVRFACRVDDAPFAPCKSPLVLDELDEGVHRFAVTAEDKAGNVSEPAVFEWTVDLTPPPAPTIDAGPGDVVIGGDATIEFSSTEHDVGFRCTLDDAPPATCTSPVELSGLPDGDHVVEIVARDAAGNESDAVYVRWLVTPDQMTLGDGAWSWFADPRVVHYKGKTYAGWVDRGGDVKVSAYDHATLTKTTALVQASVQVDDHANPALQILPDGRVRVYYSPHTGAPMWYRTTLAPEDISAWGPPVNMPENTPGSRGYTYPNPIYLAAERRTYLFWRGGNYNPSFSTQPDGSDSWTPVGHLIAAPGRPYVKYDGDGEDTIHVAFTNAHPNESPNSNIYYAAYRDGALWKADGTRIGTAPIAPADADVVFDEPANAWIHDVAHDAQGRPVLVFAEFVQRDPPAAHPDTYDHRYWYARWNGEDWVVRLITSSGGSISEDSREPYYSGGLTLDHEDPSVVYLSRQASANVWEIETWTTPDGGDTWSVEAVTAGSDTKNVRPVSPRGMLPFSSDMSVLWMRGRYRYFLTYETSIATILRTGGDAPPVADATTTPRDGHAPLSVAFDGGASQDPEGTSLQHQWDFGDGTTATGAQTTHVYAAPGRYAARLTVTDGAGRRDTYITEVRVRPGAITGPALHTTGGDATLHGAVPRREQPTTYHFEYGTDAFAARTPDVVIEPGSGSADVEATITGLTPGARYRYRLVVDTPQGSTFGAERFFTADALTPYRDVVLGTPGLLGHWRLGETAGAIATDELGARHGTYAASGVTLGQPGALPADPNTAAAFDGMPGEMTATTPLLTTSGTLEGWFQWHQGVAIMRDHSSTGGTGWILAYGTGGMIACRAGGANLISRTRVSSLGTGWHHFALTRDGREVRLYLDGELLELPDVDPGSAWSVGPWHVMRNGNSPTEYTRGLADEVAVYEGALTAADIKQRAALGPPR
ncbi:MAG TPA: BNR-4 repeat-containing protein [Gemmatimonadaceae bacterium]|nr:BNR-4 repeat-containing protein [Gemmatimonadaceae bacterium]